MIIPKPDSLSEDVIVPFTYTEGNFIVSNFMPTDEECKELSVHDITSKEG